MLDVSNIYLRLCRDGLEQLYAAGARRFAVWDLCAGEAVPLANTLNSLMNTVNAILQGIRALDARQNALRDFTKTFVASLSAWPHAAALKPLLPSCCHP